MKPLDTGDTGVSDSLSSQSSGSEKKSAPTPRDPPSLKEELRRRMKRSSSSKSSSCDKSCVYQNECPHCSGLGRVTTRLFAEEPKSNDSPTEGTAGHVQARNRHIPVAGRYQEDADDVACEAAMRKCIYSTGRTLRVMCLVLTPLLILLLCLGPYFFNRLPPAARQLSSLAFPALRLWQTPPGPSRQSPCPSCHAENHPGVLTSLFSLHSLVPTRTRTGSTTGFELVPLPSVEKLQEEFVDFTPGHIGAPQMLLDHTQEFHKEILQVADGVYVALGFGLANCVILQGPEGLVVVDTMESIESMQEVWRAWEELQKQQNKQKQKVKGIIYTHFHTDHTFGAAAIYEEGVTEVHANWLTRDEMEKTLTLTGGSTYRRSMRQFGGYIQSDDFVNAGIGPELKYTKTSGIGTVVPTHVLQEVRKTVRIAGLEMDLLHAPGESKDHMIVWLKDSRVLLGGDNIYKSLPNVYAIRGTETRNCNDWVASLDLMRGLQPEVLVLGHTRPLTGRDYIYSTLTAYRDAIQYLHDQTIRLMNNGQELNDIVHSIHLPRHLAEHPYLRPLYGTVPWAVRAIFTHYMGWFSGAAEDLSQLSGLEWAEGLQDLAGGFHNLMHKSLQALRDERYEWALETATAACTLQPENDVARQLKVTALRALAANQTAATGRNWYLTAALETEGKAVLQLSDFQKRQVLQKLTLQQIFALFSVRINPEVAENVESVILFKFDGPKPSSDDNTPGVRPEQHCVHFRRGVVYTRNSCEKEPNVTVETTAKTWLKILTRETGPVLAVAKGEMKVTGSLMLLIRSLAAVEMDAE